MRGASLPGSRTRRPRGELRPAVREARVSAHPDRPGGRAHSESIREPIRAREAVPGRTVWKFGGTSVADAARLREMARIVAGAPAPPVVVVSAMAGTTDRLVGIAETIQAGSPAWSRPLAELRARHAAALAELASGDPTPRAELEAELTALTARVEAAAAASWRERGSELRDHVVSLGEDLSARLATHALLAAGVPARFVGAREIVRTDERFGRAHPENAEIARLAEARLLPLLAQGIVPVIQGFVGATADGRTTTLGRGGSDYSAASLGAAIDADEVHIWTDVDGILSGDPRAVDHPRILTEIGYEEAVELAYFGAKVVHPGAAKHAVALGVPLRIRNSFRPEARGTLILGPTGGAPPRSPRWRTSPGQCSSRSAPSRPRSPMASWRASSACSRATRCRWTWSRPATPPRRSPSTARKSWAPS